MRETRVIGKRRGEKTEEDGLTGERARRRRRGGGRSYFTLPLRKETSKGTEKKRDRPSGEPELSSERGKFHHEKNNRIWVWNVVSLGGMPDACICLKGRDFTSSCASSEASRNPSGERLSEQIEPAGKGREGGEGRF